MVAGAARRGRGRERPLGAHVAQPPPPRAPRDRRPQPRPLAANGGGANAILVRGAAIDEHRVRRLTRRPERRVHARRRARRRRLGREPARLQRSRPSSAAPTSSSPRPPRAPGRATRRWSSAATSTPRGPPSPAAQHVARHHVDHIFAAGREPAGRWELLDAGTLSDHRPLRVTLVARQGLRRPKPRSISSARPPIVPRRGQHAELDGRVVGVEEGPHAVQAPLPQLAEEDDVHDRRTGASAARPSSGAAVRAEQLGRRGGVRAVGQPRARRVEPHVGERRPQPRGARGDRRPGPAAAPRVNGSS